MITKFPLQEFVIDVPNSALEPEEVERQSKNKATLNVSVIDSTDFAKYSAEELEKVKQKMFEEGFKAAKEEFDIAKLELQENNFLLLSAIQQKLEGIKPIVEAQYNKLGQDVGELAHAVALKVIGSAVKSFPKEIIMEFLATNLSLIYSEPLITIKLNSENYEEIVLSLPEIQKFVAEGVKIDIVKSKEVAKGDCIIDFEKGVIARDTKKLLAQLGDVLGNYFNLTESSYKQ